MLKSSPSHGTVLLVDDYPSGLLVGKIMIEHFGYKVETATCGLEAVEKVRLRLKPFMVILMDINMPDISGLEATKIIRELEKTRDERNIIYAVTAHALDGDRERCLEAGMNDYIIKPIHFDFLAQKLSALDKLTCVA